MSNSSYKNILDCWTIKTKWWGLQSNGAAHRVISPIECFKFMPWLVEAIYDLHCLDQFSVEIPWILQKKKEAYFRHQCDNDTKIPKIERTYWILSNTYLSYYSCCVEWIGLVRIQSRGPLTKDFDKVMTVMTVFYHKI